MDVEGCRIRVFLWVAPLASPMVSKRLQDDPQMPQMVPKIAEMDPNVPKKSPNACPKKVQMVSKVDPQMCPQLLRRSYKGHGVHRAYVLVHIIS